MFINRGGFTLLEVMITMAVSSMMLISAIVLFNGQQRKTQFAQSARDLQLTIQGVANDTSTGYFPNSSYTCTPSPTGPHLSALTATQQGANQGCVFLGKAIHFKDTTMDIYPVIGNRTDASGSTATFQTSLPVVVSELVDTKTYQSSVDVYQIWWGDNVTSHSADGHLIVFGSTPNGTGTAAAGDFFNSGVQKINAYSSSPTNPVAVSDNASTINNVMQNIALSWPTTNEVTVCIEDAPITDGNRQYAGIVISGGSAGISVRQQVETDAVKCS
jgi:prepilin-type N-terminal cleavage/methylation domain-containing protein